MKKKIHPDYHTITVVMTNGTEYQTRSTWGEEGDDAQPRHRPVDATRPGPAATSTLLDRGGRVSRFNNKFKGFIGG